MKFYHIPVPEDDREFFRALAEILWYEERLYNLIASAVNLGLWGKKK